MYFNSIYKTMVKESDTVKSLIDIQAFIGEYIEDKDSKDNYMLNSDYGVSIYNDGSKIFAAFAELDFRNMMNINYVELSKDDKMYYPATVNQVINKIIYIAEKLKAIDEYSAISKDKTDSLISIIARKNGLTTFKLNVIIDMTHKYAKEASEQMMGNTIKIYLKSEVVEI